MQCRENDVNYISNAFLGLRRDELIQRRKKKNFIITSYLPIRWENHLGTHWKICSFLLSHFSILYTYTYLHFKVLVISKLEKKIKEILP